MAKDNLQVIPFDIHLWTAACLSSVWESLLGIRLRLKVLLPQTWKLQNSGHVTPQHEPGHESIHPYRIYISNMTLTRVPHHGINLSRLPLYDPEFKASLTEATLAVMPVRQDGISCSEPNNACNNCTAFSSIVIVWLIKLTLWSHASDPWNLLESSNLSGAWRIIRGALRCEYQDEWRCYCWRWLSSKL